MDLDDRNYLQLLDAEEVRRKIEAFELLDFSVESEERIKSAILDIFCVEKKGKYFFTLSVYLISYLPNECLYRVRKADSFSKGRPMCESDFWGNPSAPQNRFNREGETTLYVSRKVSTAIQETKVAKNDCFILVEYSNISPLELCPTEISNRYGDDAIDNEALSLLNNFINNLARVRISEGEQHKYKATRALADVINMLPEKIEATRDGMIYISAYTGEMENIVLKSTAISKLKINNIWLACLNDDGAVIFLKQIFIEQGNVRIDNVQPTSLRHIGETTKFVKGD